MENWTDPEEQEAAALWAEPKCSACWSPLRCQTFKMDDGRTLCEDCWVREEGE